MENTEQKSTRSRTRKVNLNTAKIADGAVQSSKSVYEICGISTDSYKTDNVHSYRRMLDGMDLYELQSHAFNLAIPAGSDRTIIIDRLERKFLQEKSRFVGNGETSQEVGGTDKKLREQAATILARGR